MDRLVSRPTAPSSLQDPKWSRVSRRIESMIISAAPTVVRQELSAARVSGLLNVVSRLFCIYGPGGLAERELGLKHIPTANAIQEAIDGLRAVPPPSSLMAGYPSDARDPDSRRKRGGAAHGGFAGRHWPMDADGNR